MPTKTKGFSTPVVETRSDNKEMKGKGKENRTAEKEEKKKKEREPTYVGRVETEAEVKGRETSDAGRAEGEAKAGGKAIKACKAGAEKKRLAAKEANAEAGVRK